MKITVPKEIQNIAEELIKAGFQAYLVGGCVRDLLLAQMGESRINADLNADKRGKFLEPKDWDIATNAKPGEIQKIFPDSVYENQFGTVAVKTQTNTDRTRTKTDKTQTDIDQNTDSHGKSQSKSVFSPYQSVSVVEVTTFRLEGKYTDKRHPDEIKFAKTIEEDLARRDFTVNAMAMALQSAKRKAPSVNNLQFAISDLQIVDPFGGQEDLKKKLIRAVGNPDERFSEDALRLMRAVRFAAQLEFTIEPATQAAIKKHAGLLEFIAKERIRDELEKILMSDDAVQGIEMLREFDLLRHVLPEIEEGVGVGQNKHHIYTVYEHNLKSFEYAVKENFSLDVRLASLLHDVGKPRVKGGEGPDSTFYGHQVIGERMVLEMLDRLHFPRKLVERVALLVREHMFVYDPDTVTLAGVRRLVRRAGPENMEDLLKLREADRIGSGVPKAQPYRLRYLKAMIEKVQKDPIHPKMLKIKGDAVMEILRIEPGPKVGKVLAILLEEVLDEPSLNEGDKLKKRAQELGKLSERELNRLAERAKRKAEDVQKRIDDEIKKKYFVK